MVASILYGDVLCRSIQVLVEGATERDSMSEHLSCRCGHRPHVVPGINEIRAVTDRAYSSVNANSLELSPTFSCTRSWMGSSSKATPDGNLTIGESGVNKVGLVLVGSKEPNSAR